MMMPTRAIRSVHAPVRVRGGPGSQRRRKTRRDIETACARVSKAGDGGPSSGMTEIGRRAAAEGFLAMEAARRERGSDTRAGDSPTFSKQRESAGHSGADAVPDPYMSPMKAMEVLKERERHRAEMETPQPMLQREKEPGESVSSFWDWSPAKERDEELVLDRMSDTSSQSSGEPSLVELLRAGTERPTVSSASIETFDSSCPVVAPQSEAQIESAAAAAEEEEESTPKQSPETIPMGAQNALPELEMQSFAMYADAAQSTSGRSSGVELDGSRWWREAGSEEVGDGRLRRWVCMRGLSQDREVEWEQRWWETSDAVGYRELGAEKSGRDREGNVWRECWIESLTKHNDACAVIERCADKVRRTRMRIRTRTRETVELDGRPASSMLHSFQPRRLGRRRGRAPMELKHAIVLARRQHQYHRQWARAPDKSEWHETWAEEFSTSGAVQRSADKFGCKAPGSIPEDGHANRWQERWGENWDGHGNVLKWTDKWAERDQSEGGGPPRSWGDKWEERNAEMGGSKNVRAHTIESTVLPVVSPRLPALRLTDCSLCDCVTISFS